MKMAAPRRPASSSRAASSSRSTASSILAEGAEVGYRSIGLTLLVTFAVSFAYLYHKQRAQDLMAVPPGPVVVAHASPTPLPPPPLPAAGPAKTVERAAPPVRAMMPPVAPAANPPEEADQGPTAPVPVALILRRDRRAGGGTGGVEGSIRNESEKPLTVTIISQNRNGDETGRTMLALDALQKKPIGTDEGMAIQSGDHLVIQSQGFQDKESSAP
jgi:hypothetical protein